MGVCMPLEPTQLNNKCPICNKNLEVEAKYKASTQHSFYEIHCESVHSHFRVWIHQWPKTWKGVDFSKWVFGDNDILCPICESDITGKACKDGSLQIFCKEASIHFNGFIKNPEKINWPIFNKDDEKTEQEVN